MTNRRNTSRIFFGVVLLFATSCTHTLPQYQWINAASALTTMKHRDSGIRTISATFSLLLQSGEGQVELKGAIVAAPPNQLRFRAWKLTRTVLDITLNADGLFVFSAEKNGGTNASPTKLTHDRLLEAVAFLPGFSDATSWEIGTSLKPDVFAISQKRSPGNAKMSCFIDKKTLTTRNCTYFDEHNFLRQMLVFENYKDSNGVAWPMHLSGNGENGKFDIHFSNVIINEELSNRAFVPTRRAKKQS